MILVVYKSVLGLRQFYLKPPWDGSESMSKDSDGIGFEDKACDIQHDTVAATQWAQSEAANSTPLERPPM
jgi:hypothetical protein